MSNGREPLVVDTFMALTDTLVSDFDALDMLTMLVERSVALLDVSAPESSSTRATAAGSRWPRRPPSGLGCSRCSPSPSTAGPAWTASAAVDPWSAT